MRKGRAITAIAIGCVIVGSCAGAIALFFRLVTVPFHVRILASFDKLPPTDNELEAWLKQQPGVPSFFCTIYRSPDKPRCILFSYTLVQNLTGKPPNPDLESACRRFGYQGGKFRFPTQADEDAIWAQPPPHLQAWAPITHEEFKQIENGMTLIAVRSCLGRPAGDYRSLPGVRADPDPPTPPERLVHWKTDDIEIYVIFDKAGMVRHKWSKTVGDGRAKDKSK